MWGWFVTAFSIVAEFEEVVASFAGSRYAVATNTGTSALFLSMKYAGKPRQTVTFPARTFISVPMAAIQAGLNVEFRDYKWNGVYEIKPLNVIDGALRFRRGMYGGGLHCLSFHARKLLNIGEGGMVLTNDLEAALWLKASRYSGRKAPQYRVEDVSMLGWQYYMTPEKAARGLHLMDYMRDNLRDRVMEYPDLRKVKAFQCDKITS